MLYTGGGDGVVKSWNTESGKCIGEMQGHRAGILDVAASLDDEYVAASSTDQHKINIYRTKTCNKLLSLTGHSDAVNSLKFNYSRKALISGSSDRTLRTWDIEKN